MVPVATSASMIACPLPKASAEICSAAASAVKAAASAILKVSSSSASRAVGASPLRVVVPAITLIAGPLPSTMIPARDWTVTSPAPASSWPIVMVRSALTRMFPPAVLRLPMTATAPLPKTVPA